MPIKLPLEITDDVITQWGDCLDLKTVAGREALKIALENVVLLDGKQQDYGSKNISEFGAYGCLVRMSDKFERMKNLYGKRHHSRSKAAVNESVMDSWRDFSNYGIIGFMCEKGVWPNE